MKAARFGPDRHMHIASYAYFVEYGYQIAFFPSGPHRPGDALRFVSGYLVAIKRILNEKRHKCSISRLEIP